jgi:hypothetical protein
MSYEVWDLATGNLIGTFDDRAAAIAFLHDEVDARGSRALDDLALDHVRDDESVDVVGQGRSLLDLIQTAAPTR